ncbi:MAG TPA: MBL fold metallo-hydrolase [Solirubrobacteraceae bacterium]|jgi:hypothetical protein|nr:MBL fold metallo-hydrolase [Solirubrobacteraceae bacterium]
MYEVLPGIVHWSAPHPRIGAEVSSYWLEPDGVLIDPLVPPDGGLEWLARRPAPPAVVVLSNRHHYRDAGRFAERFGATVHAPRSGLHEFTNREAVTGYDPGQALPGGIVAFEIGGLCPDETALYLTEQRAVLFADGVVRGDLHSESGPLGFVPDALMDDPPATKRALLNAFERALEELEFEHVLLAHGGAVIGDGRAQLEDLVRCGGRTAFEM